jgi:hypothetical protein
VTCFFLSAISLKRLNAVFRTAPETVKPSSSSAALSAARPECLPSTREFVSSPMVEASMISNVERSLSTPSWWMPDSCRKALRPTIALLGCTA